MMSYTLLVICMWAWHGLGSGLGYETTFVLNSETKPGLRGFRYEADRLRVFMSLFYHLAYELARLIGQDGSFVTYQLVYGALWLLRGLLVFWVVRMLAQASDPTAFLAGAFTILHAADSSLNWVGQLNQFGFILWMLIAFFLVLRAFDDGRSLKVSMGFAAGATLSAGLSLFSYESPLFLVLFFPLIAIILFDKWSHRKLWILAIYYVVPGIYCLLSVVAYLVRTRRHTYQFSVLRSDWDSWAILGDWVHNVWHSLAFWRWPKGYADLAPEAGATGMVVFFFCGLAVIILVVGFVFLRRMQDSEQAVNLSPIDARKVALLGLAMIVLSYPVYLVLGGATSGWRTQLLSGPGAGIFFAGAVSLIGSVRPLGHRLGFGGALTASIALVVHGIWASQSQALVHRLNWDRHRDIVAGVLMAAPKVKEHTFIVLINESPQSLIFGHNMWWDVASRLAYPMQAVAGMYFEAPKRPAPGVKIEFAGSRLALQSDFPMMFEETDIANLLILDVLADKRVRVADRVPDWFEIAPQFRDRYDPTSRIKQGLPDPRAVRRYLTP